MWRVVAALVAGTLVALQDDIPVIIQAVDVLAAACEVVVTGLDDHPTEVTP